uniref:LpxL/LpxP family Kdo(2)-lipid IV(A) lauroyl/palmitoleoyl acyltransferase n=1 Tax=Thaumasiovibrio occultus TaxID=1891184 RepID=UPI000B353D1B|nr:LpxL/LpxP family Kdo(2)-lipid IV(A) lauroyl/palmitoleoyl acyltransferase [Thaumasiovibrio occultus]
MNDKYAAPRFHVGLLHPRYWLVWIGVGLMYLVSWLPYSVLFVIGKLLGRIMMKIMHKRLFVIRKNLELCFPELSGAEREKIVKENIDNTGLAMVESCIAWFWPRWRLRRLVKVEGMDKLIELNDKGQGVLMLGYHNLNLEICAKAIGEFGHGWGVYRPNNNPAFDYVQYRGRLKGNAGLIHKRNIGGMIAAIKKGDTLWYMPDHDYGLRRSVFVPYFAVEDACTTTGTSLLVDASDAVVAGFTFSRDTDNRGYTAKVFIVEDFPRNDPEAAAAKANEVIANSVRQAPGEYMWLHRRFKNRPEGQPSLYGANDPRAK